MDLIWLEIQAWHQGKSMKEQDSLLCEARSTIPDVLSKVIDFKYDSSFEAMCCKPQSSLSFVDIKETFSACSISCEHYVEHINQAYDQISELLEEVYEIESLYPSLKCMSSAHSLYNNVAFDTKHRTLCLWINIISDIRIKLNLLSSLFGIKYGWKLRNSFRICELECDNILRMPYDSGIANSTGTTPSPSILPASSLESSFYSDSESQEPCHNADQKIAHSNYHSYVEKMLRQKGGLRKIMFQVKDLLKPTLIRISSALHLFLPSNTYASVVTNVSKQFIFCCFTFNGCFE